MKKSTISYDCEVNTKKEFEEILNECGCPKSDLKSLGGRCPDNTKYGSWLRKNDPIAFEVAYREDVAEARDYYMSHKDC